jgi:hypothetical protein
VAKMCHCSKSSILMGTPRLLISQIPRSTIPEHCFITSPEDIHSTTLNSSYILSWQLLNSLGAERASTDYGHGTWETSIAKHASLEHMGRGFIPHTLGPSMVTSTRGSLSLRRRRVPTRFTISRGRQRCIKARSDTCKARWCRYVMASSQGRGMASI